jgi:hypothetical protein
MTNNINVKLELLQDRIRRIEKFFEEKNIPYYGEVIKLQIQDKIKKDRMDIVMSLMNYDETQFEILNDKIDISIIFYECVATLGLNLYKEVLNTNTRCH